MCGTNMVLLLTTAIDCKSNNQYVIEVQTFRFFQVILQNIRLQIYSNYNHFYTQVPIFRGSNLIGQLTREHPGDAFSHAII